MCVLAGAANLFLTINNAINGFFQLSLLEHRERNRARYLPLPVVPVFFLDALPAFSALN